MKRHRIVLYLMLNIAIDNACKIIEKQPHKYEQSTRNDCVFHRYIIVDTIYSTGAAREKTFHHAHVHPTNILAYINHRPLYIVFNLDCFV